MNAILLAAALLVSQPAPVDVRPTGLVRLSSEPEIVLVLQNVRGQCPGGTRRFYIVNVPTARIWVGCWTLSENRLAGIDEDGDILDLPAERVQWTKEGEGI